MSMRRWDPAERFRPIVFAIMDQALLKPIDRAGGEISSAELGRIVWMNPSAFFRAIERNEEAGFVVRFKRGGKLWFRLTTRGVRAAYGRTPAQRISRKLWAARHAAP